MESGNANDFDLETWQYGDQLLTWVDVIASSMLLRTVGTSRSVVDLRDIRLS